ncbi:hypothetical protein D3C78_1145110 [compost metagenome]
MGVVPGHPKERVQGNLERLAQFLVAGVVVLAQYLAGEALEFPRVVVGRRETGDQCLPETATA